MGWIDTILGSVASFGQQALQNRYNSKEAQKNRDFQSAEAAAQRNWSAAQAEQAQDWNEEMFEKYNSLSGKISQAEKAGVNPLFAITGNATTPAPTSSPVPSGASAGSVGNPTSAFVDLVGNILGLSKLKSDIALTESQTELNKAEAEVSLKKLASEISNLDSQTSLNVQKVLESATSIEKIKSDMNLNERQAEVFASQINYIDSQANYINAIKEPELRIKQSQAIISEWQEKNKELFKGLEIGSDILQIATDIGLGIFNAKTGRLFTDSPVVVPKGASVFRPSTIVD